MMSSRLPTLRGRELVLVGSLCGSWRSTSVWEKQGACSRALVSHQEAPAPPADKPQGSLGRSLGACTGRGGFGPVARFGQSGEEPRWSGPPFTLLQPRGIRA